MGNRERVKGTEKGRVKERERDGKVRVRERLKNKETKIGGGQEAVEERERESVCVEGCV